MRYEHTAVATTADIREAHHKIDGKVVMAIRQLLTERPPTGNEAVAWVDEWLTDEKPLIYEESCPQVALGVIERESDKAWLFGQAKSEADSVWLPKSASRMFVLEDGVTEVDTEQRTFGDL